MSRGLSRRLTWLLCELDRGDLIEIESHHLIQLKSSRKFRDNKFARLQKNVVPSNESSFRAGKLLSSPLSLSLTDLRPCCLVASARTNLHRNVRTLNVFLFQRHTCYIDGIVISTGEFSPADATEYGSAIIDPNLPCGCTKANF